MKNQRSFSSQEKSFTSYKRHQQSILSEYKKVGFGQESFYFSADPIQYSPIPLFITKDIAKQFTHCINLQNFSFYQMLTFAIFQHLLKNPNQKQVKMVNKLKSLICHDNFLSHAAYTKGLIIKGLNVMIQNSKNENYSRPVAEVLMGNEKLSAFCECWKEMILYLKKQATNSNNDDITSSMVEIFAQFFDIEFQFYTKKPKQFQLQVIKSKKLGQKTATIPIVLTTSTLDQPEENASRQGSLSQISSIQGNWTYYILLKQDCLINSEQISFPLSRMEIDSKSKIRKLQTLTVDYPQLFPIDEQNSQYVASNIYCDEKDNLNTAILNAKKVMRKGSQLLIEMANFVKQLQKQHLNLS